MVCRGSFFNTAHTIKKQYEKNYKREKIVEAKKTEKKKTTLQFLNIDKLRINSEE